MLAQRITRVEPPTTPAKSKALLDPEPLTDGIEPPFDSWKILMTSKLTVNANHFDNEEAKILYLFGRIRGKAQKYLKAQFSPNSIDPF